MSILRSLFGSKKKGKRPTSPSGSASAHAKSSHSTSSTASNVRAPSPVQQQSSSSRFLSLRRKSSIGSPLDAAVRRNSGEANRKRRASPVKASVQDESYSQRKEWELPSLGFENGNAGALGSASGLGLDAVGAIPSLTEEEQRALALARIGPDELGKGWKALGGVLRSTDHPSAILELPAADREQQIVALSAMMYLVGQPSKLRSFPTFGARYPSLASAEASTIWSDRLIDLARASSPQDTAAALKWALRKLAVTSGDSSTSPGPLISSPTYIQFVQGEHAASYPLDAYHQILSSRVPPRIMRFLHEVFDVWAALTAHADDQSGLAGKMALLMGWWIMQPDLVDLESWDEMYAAWRLAARRVEHLFLAWIRHQSTTHTLPTRLLRLVSRYPYGESDYSAETLPLPPPSSFTRKTLHLRLQSAQPLSSLPEGPASVVQAALSIENENAESCPIWESILRAVDGKEAEDIENVVDEVSVAFLARAGQQSGPSADISAEPPTPRPAHARRNSNAKALDALAEEVGMMADAHDAARSPIPKSITLGTPLPRSESTWDDFRSSGFAPSRAGDLDLALAPSPVFPSASPIDNARRHPRLNGLAGSSTTSQPIRFDSPVGYSTEGEEIIDVDDMFLSFAEESQLDADATKQWPRFVMLRLRHPVAPAESADPGAPIERILITVSHSPPPPTPPPKTPPEDTSQPRAASPSAESPFRFGSFGFKRTPSRPTFRSAFFGSSKSVTKDDTGSDFINGDTGETKRLTIHHKASTTSLNELGQMFRRTSRQNSNVGSAENGSIPQSPVRDRVRPSIDEQSSRRSDGPLPALGEDGPLSLPTAPPASGGGIDQDERANGTIQPEDPERAISQLDPQTAQTRAGSAMQTDGLSDGKDIPSGPSRETSADHWSYGAEGGAHVVFPYSGPASAYSGRLLRIRKISNHRDDPLEATSALWRDVLLARVVPESLLIQAQKVKMDGDWLVNLLQTAEHVRPSDRQSTGKLVQLVGEDPSASVMENMRMSGEASSSRKVLAVEIKPKWGFLPDAAHIHPPEAASIKSATGRYTLHQHYRGTSHSHTQQDVYDPLDLFAEDDSRLTAALSGLWGIWRESEGKANSFRVFVDGKIVHPDERDASATLLDITAPILIPLLRRSECLKVLRRLQSSLDPIDISGLAAPYRAAHPDGPLFDEQHVPDIQAEEMGAFVSKYLSDPSAGKIRTAWTLRERIIGYSLSAIFKDCSIIIRAVLSPKDDGGWNVEDESIVKLLDLDLKPLKMRHWAELDEKIWRHWYETKVLPLSTAQVEKANDGEGDLKQVHESAAGVPRNEQSGPLESNTTSIVDKQAKSVPGEFPGVPDIPPTPAAIEAPSDPTATAPLMDRSEQVVSEEDRIPPSPAQNATVQVSETATTPSTPSVPGAFNFSTPPHLTVTPRLPGQEVLADGDHNAGTIPTQKE